VRADEKLTAFLELESAIRLILRDLLDKKLSSLKISMHQNRAGLANGQFLSARLYGLFRAALAELTTERIERSI
jgi:hypothetical protein